MDPESQAQAIEIFREYDLRTSGAFYNKNNKINFKKTCERYGAKNVSPMFTRVFGCPFVFHAELTFKSCDIMDWKRLDLIVDDIVENLDFKAHELCGFPSVQEENDDPVLIPLVAANSFNEFSNSHLYPKLHILISLHPQYFAKINESVFSNLKTFTDEYVRDYDIATKVSRISNRASLLCEILGSHKDRFFRMLN
jgi:hypothetical protein